jgi:glutaminase
MHPREHAIYSRLEPDSDGRVRGSTLLRELLCAGLAPDDVRIREATEAILKDPRAPIDFGRFRELVGPNIVLVERALTGQLIIPEFTEFSAELQKIFDDSAKNRDGNVADYIPQLSRVDPEQFGAAVCTLDGQRFTAGHAREDFCVQSCCKPINYCLALEEHGEDKVHEHIGREPSGRGFNELALNDEGRPHNPMINSGAIMACSLIRPQEEVADRFDFVMGRWKALCGNQKVGFSNSVYLSERKTADRNFALGYLMQEHKGFPQQTNLIETLEFYFQCCSIETNAEQLSVVAATLANGGVCPTTGERIFSTQTVQNCLSLMSSCGMYDFSGEFAFSIGLPAKSGVAGAVFGVVPNVMGFCTWSPRLDRLGNSVRGIEFCRRLVETFNFHMYDSLTATEKHDPRRTRSESRSDEIGQMIWAASMGDLGGVNQLVARGVSINEADYDRRTPLHLAAAEGRLEMVRALLRMGADPMKADRYGHTPLDDARKAGHETVAELLVTAHRN